MKQGILAGLVGLVLLWAAYSAIEVVYTACCYESESVKEMRRATEELRSIREKNTSSPQP